jgi:uncharacterized protein (TIGR02246 family)
VLSQTNRKGVTMNTLMRTGAGLLACLLMAGLLTFWGATAVQADANQEVAAATAKWIETFNRKDLEQMVALYAPDAVFWGTTSQALRTTPADVRAYFAGPPPVGGPNIKADIVEQHVRVFGDIGLNSGIYRFQIVMKDGKARSINARFSFAYQKRGNEWLIVDHHSSFMPAPRKKK